MFFKGITIIEHDDLFCHATFNNEFHFNVFRFKQDDEKFVSNE